MIFFFFNDTPPTAIYTLSLHDALPIYRRRPRAARLLLRDEKARVLTARACWLLRSEEHTSELQSRRDLVCRLLLEKKKSIEFFDHSIDRFHLLVHARVT